MPTVIYNSMSLLIFIYLYATNTNIKLIQQFLLNSDIDQKFASRMVYVHVSPTPPLSLHIARLANIR